MRGWNRAADNREKKQEEEGKKKTCNNNNNNNKERRPNNKTRIVTDPDTGNGAIYSGFIILSYARHSLFNVL